MPFISQKKFSDEMKRCCLKKYKSIPSNAKLANDFYVSTHYKLKVNQETFRLWLKGESFPDLNSLLYLIQWLELNLKNIFDFQDHTAIEGKLVTKKTSVNAVESLSEIDIDAIINILNSMKKDLNHKS